MMSSGTGCDDTRPVKERFVFKQMENQEGLMNTIQSANFVEEFVLCVRRRGVLKGLKLVGKSLLRSSFSESTHDLHELINR